MDAMKMGANTIMIKHASVSLIDIPVHCRVSDTSAAAIPIMKSLLSNKYTKLNV